MEKTCNKCNKLLYINLFDKEDNRIRNTCKICRLDELKKKRNLNKLNNEKNINSIKEKKCISCNKLFNISNYYKQSTSKDGYRSYCISCSKLNRKKEITKKEVIITKKICNTCNKEKLVNEFKSTNKSSDGFYHKCIGCWPTKTWTKEKQKESEKKYVRNNPEKIKEKNRKQGLNINRRIRKSLNQRIKDALFSKSLRKDNNTLNYVGCNLDLLKKWFEFLFEENMSFGNYGEWHIDHIKPCSSYNFSKEEDIKECFNWKNLRPCWGEENLQKSSQLNTELIENYKNKVNIFINNLLPSQSSNSIDGAN